MRAKILWIPISLSLIVSPYCIAAYAESSQNSKQQNIILTNRYAKITLCLFNQ